MSCTRASSDVPPQSSGRIVLFDVKEQKMITARWSFHSARVNSLVWTPDSKHCASGSLDTHVYVWSVVNPTRSIALKKAGPGECCALGRRRRGQGWDAGERRRGWACARMGGGLPCLNQ
ncbi:hypothetical protein B0H10DRAFT_2135787, partial [Mycena sp. CBHHK59/15]